MPALEKKDMKQTAVVWDWVRYDKHGDEVVGEPREIKVRWNDNINANINADATALCKEELTIDSHIWLGTLEEWYASGSYGDTTLLMYVAGVQRGSDLKNRHPAYKLVLKYYRDTQVEE